MELVKPMRIKHILITEEGVAYEQETNQIAPDDMYVNKVAIITAFSAIEDMGGDITRLHSYNTFFDCKVPMEKMIAYVNKHLADDKQIEKLFN